MKTARFLFTLIAFGALTLRVSYADPPSKQPSQQDAHQNHATSDRSAIPAQGRQPPGKIDQTEGRPLKPKNNSQDAKPKENGGAEDLKPKDEGQHSKPKEDGRVSEKGRQAGPVKSPGKEPQQPESKKSATAAKVGPMTNKSGKPREPLARLPGGSEAVAPFPSRRAAVAAALGKALDVTRITSSARNSAGALDGAAVQRKP
jgi:hypothetical protein